MSKKTSAGKEEQFIMICPICKSPDVNMDKSNPVQPAMGLPPMYICNKCGHVGNYFPEIPVREIEEFEAEVKKGETEVKKGEPNNSLFNKESKVDIRYGIFEVRVLWKIFAPIILFLGIFLLFKEPISGSILILIGLGMYYVTFFSKRKLKEK